MQKLGYIHKNPTQPHWTLCISRKSTSIHHLDITSLGKPLLSFWPITKDDGASKRLIIVCEYRRWCCHQRQQGKQFVPGSLPICAHATVAGDNTLQRRCCQGTPTRAKGVYDNLLSDLNLKANSVPLLAGEVVNADQGGICASMNKIIATLPQTIPQAHVISSAG